MNAILSDVTVLFRVEKTTPKYKIPLALERVSAGAFSPADDYIEQAVDMNALLIPNPLSTFMVRANSQSMQQARIEENDILIVDRSINAAHSDIVIAELNGEKIVKTLMIEETNAGKKVWLRAENPEFASIYPRECDEILIWGVVTWNLCKLYQLHRKCA